MATTEWYMKMAAAIGRRGHAENMIGKWREKLDAAEQEIELLKGEVEQTPEQAPEQVQE